MIKNYLIISVRNLFKQKFYSLINILGLSIGLACFLFIALFVTDELRYDTHFKNADKVYRMDFSGSINGNDVVTAIMSAPAAKTMSEDYPEVEDAFRFRTTGTWYVKRRDQELTYKEENVIHADPNFFTFWDYPLTAGDPETCLSRPNTLVLDQTTATKIFGKEDPIGQIVILDSETDYEVTGVYPDFPENTHFSNNMMLTMEDRADSKSSVWMSFNFNTYLKLSEGAKPAALEAKFPELIESKVGPEIKQFMNMSFEEFQENDNNIGFFLFPLKDIHLYSDKLGDLEANGDINYVYIFSAIGLFILLLAIINFMNLATARSSNRAKEVGLRKVMGAYRSQLIGQFISEAMIITLISMLIAFCLALLLLPSFNELTGKSLTFDNLTSTSFLAISFAIFIVVGVLSGSYPAFYLSSFRPAETLKGKLNLGFNSGGIRSTLVVVQFTVSIIMIIGTAIVFDQLSFIQNKKLGFDKNQVLMVHDAWLLDKQVDAFKTEALRNSNIESGTVSSFFPVGTTNNNNIYWPGVDMNGAETYIVHNFWIDTDYISTLGMKIKDGRNFSKDFPSDSSGILVNEALVRDLGLQDPIGQIISTYGGDSPEDSEGTNIDSYKILGVIEDFHFASMKKKINPVLFHLGRQSGFVAFRMKTEETEQTISFLKDKWDELAPGQPFSHSFLDERFNNIYSSEKQVGQVFGIFAFLVIFIACLGLFGLASFTAEQKRKEIGIRKVLGASVSSIVNKLSLNFIKLVGISFVIAAPISYFAMDTWLQDFAFRTDLKIWIFLIAGISAGSIAWLTMSFQSWKAASANPVQSLRNE
ncbi:MAG: ABC transporter permease [Cyclobacteriaceae bacterium]